MSESTIIVPQVVKVVKAVLPPTPQTPVPQPGVVTPLVKPSNGTTAPATPVEKRVVFTCRGGAWSAEVELNDVTKFFTPKDFYQLSILLNLKRNVLKRQAFLKYHELCKQQVAQQVAERV